jgi:hypothetical protein
MRGKLIVALIVGVFVIVAITLLLQPRPKKVEHKINLNKIERKMTKKELRREIGELRGIVRILKKYNFNIESAAKEYGEPTYKFELLMKSWGLDTLSTREIGSMGEKLYQKMEEINN